MKPIRPKSCCESLEGRRLLTISVTATAAADVIRIAASGDQVLVVVNGDPFLFAADPEGIVVNAGAGNDTIRLDDASNLPVTINGEANDDRIEVGAGDVRAARLATVDVVGGAGNDSLFVDDSLSATANLNVSIDNPIDTYVSLVAASGSVIRSDASSAANAVETVTYAGTPQGDNVYVHGTSALSTLLINGGSGDDSMTVGNDIDSKLKGPVTLSGNAGANVLTIDDSADSFADTYFLGGNATTGTVRKNSGGSTATFSGFGNVSLIAGQGGAVPNNQIFRIAAFPDNISTTIFAGNGDDTLFFGDGVTSLDAFKSNLLFDGGDGPADAIVYNDTLGNDAVTYNVDASSVTNPGTATLNWVNNEAISLTANAAADTINIGKMSSSVGVTVNGGAGNDTINIGNGDFDANILNGAYVLGGSGTDSLVIDDTLDDVGDDAYTFVTGVTVGVTTTNGSMTKSSATAMFWSTASADRVESISLLASANNDTIRVNNATPAIRMTLDGGPGSDSFLIASTTEGTAAATAVTIISGTGNDSLDVNSDASSSDALVAFTLPLEEFQDFHVRAGGRATIASGSNGVLAVHGLLTVGGRIDVADATMIVSAGSYAAIDALATAGYAGGAWNGGAAAAAIVSGTAAASAINDAVAVVNAADINLPTYAGVATVPGDVIVRYTIAGDANLDRVVDFNDLALLAQNYGLIGLTWAQGDLNYDVDGAVSFDDLVVLAQNYSQNVVAAAILSPLPRLH